MESKSSNNARIALAVIVVILVIALAAFGYKTLNKDRAATTPETTQTTTPTQEQTVGETESSSSYKDGTYQVIGNYISPGGPEELDVTITLTDGVITDSKVVSKAFRPNSIKFQGMFVENYKEQVTGRNIDEVTLTKVSGSSLAPKGFNDALEEIKSQASS